MSSSVTKLTLRRIDFIRELSVPQISECKSEKDYSFIFNVISTKRAISVTLANPKPRFLRRLEQEINGLWTQFEEYLPNL